MKAVLDTESAPEGIGSLPEFRSGDPIVGPTLALRRDPLTALIEPYRRFGRIFRMRLLGRAVVVVAGLDANEFAWRNAGQWAWASSGAAFRDQFGPNYLTQLDGAAHDARRKRFAPAFRSHAVDAQVPAMAGAWADALVAHAGEVIDLRSLCARSVVEATARALVGAELPEGAEDDVDALEHDVLAGASFASRRRAWFNRPSHRARKRAFADTLARAVRERRRDWSGDDLLSEILRGLPHGAVIPTVEDLVADVVLLLHAGSESTATQILWTLLLLQSRPEWVSELRAELHAWAPEHAATPGRFPRLQATVLEAERLRPAIPFSVRVAAHDLVFSSRQIPQGTTVLHAATLTHFLDEIYDDPMAFRPERFLTDGSGPAGAPVARAHGTFGGGPHGCLGQPLARLHVPLAVATLTKHADLVPFGPVSLRARLDGVASPVERHLPVRIAIRV
jgi:cytochrome P450